MSVLSHCSLRPHSAEQAFRSSLRPHSTIVFEDLQGEARIEQGVGVRSHEQPQCLVERRSNLSDVPAVAPFLQTEGER